ncbi:hypothetical protein QUC31_001722 [Theobroma cacao]
MRHQSSPEKQLYESRCFDIFLCVSILTIFSLLVLACVLIIESHPDPPIVHVNSVQALHFNISSTSLLTACLRIQLSLKNPNKKTSFSVESIMAYLVYQRRYSFLSTNINPFYLQSRTKAVVHANFDATSMFLKSNVSNGMRAELMDLEVVNFDVRIYGRAWFYPSSSWFWGWEMMYIRCNDVLVGFSSNKTSGTMLHSPRRCKVELMFQSKG